MPEGNFLNPNEMVEKKEKKTRKKPVKKKKNPSPPFKVAEKSNAKPTLPKGGLKPQTYEAVKQKAGSKGMYGKLALVFVILTVILISAVLYFGFSKVTIVLIPSQEKIADNFSVEVLDKTLNPTVSQEQIFGAVKQVPVEQTQTFSASGKEVLGQEVTGTVSIVNHYIKNQPLVASTRFLSQDGKLFRLKNTVNVPAGGQVEAEVYADEAKPEMAIGPGKFTIPGLWAGIQDKIYAESKAAMQYSEKAKYVINQSDIDNAVSQLKNNLLAKAKQDIGQAYGEYDQTLLEVDNNSVSQEIDGKVGEEKEKFTITMKTMVTIVAFKDDDIYNQAKNKLAASIADDKEVAEFSKRNLTYTLGGFNLSQGIANINVDFSAKLILRDSAKVIKKNNLTGLGFEQIKAYLNSLPEVAGYEIKFFPSFIKKMPNLADRISIEIKK